VKFPIQFGYGSSDINYHGPDREPKRSRFSVVRLGSACLAWRLIRYGAEGQWRYVDVFLRFIKPKLKIIKTPIPVRDQQLIAEIGSKLGVSYEEMAKDYERMHRSNPPAEQENKS